MRSVRVTFVVTRSVQYYAPWFRHIAACCDELDLTVVDATEATAIRQGMGRVIADTRPDVVVVNGWYSMTLVRALFACRRLGVPTLWSCDTHAGDAPRGWQRFPWRLKTRWLLNRFDGYLSPGTRVRGYLSSSGAADYRIFHVPHGVDNLAFSARAEGYQATAERDAVRREWGIAPDAFVPLFVGKLTDVKRPLDLIAAAALAAPCHVLVAGSGHLDAAVREDAKRRGVSLTMAGFLNQEELSRAYAASDCLVLPSRGETWGLVVNEALASGLPAIVSDACACGPDVMTPQTGRLFETGNPASLAAALVSLRSQLASGSLAQACRSRASKFAFDVMTDGLVTACFWVLPRSPQSAEHAVAGFAPTRILACCGQMVIVSGLERMTFGVLRALRGQGAPVHCIVNGWENHRITTIADQIGATWSAGPYWYSLSRRWTPAAIARMVWEVARVSGDLLREAHAFEPTHVVLPDFKAVLRNAPALAWLRLRGVKAIVRLGNPPDAGSFYRMLWRYGVAPFVDRLVCNSRFTHDELAAHGIGMDKILTIPNAAPPRATFWNDNVARIPGRVVYVGQLIPVKGVDLLLDAVAILRGKGSAVTLDVIGALDGWESPSERGYRRALLERASAPDLKDAVAFLGHREDVPFLMNRAVLHCCPSRPEMREGFGLVVLEAKLAGLPSVVGRSGALPELIEHGTTGWICDPVDAEQLAEGLDLFLRDAERLQRAARLALQSAAAYSQTRFDNSWRNVFAVEEANVQASYASSNWKA